jgi:multiple sugar transport system ATP-binding protein
MASVTLNNLTKRWGSVMAVRGVSLVVVDREFVVFLGPSGCGKTTTMRMIAGLEEPTIGEIWIGDRLVNDIPARDRDLAMVFQNYGLYPHMTVAENIGYPLKVRSIPRVERTERVRRAAEKVELAAYLDRRPAALSGGQRQRVALARAIVRTPQLFLMDEPLSNLDAKLRTLMRAQLKHLQRDLGITTIYVTHDQVEAMTLADRIVVLNGGLLQQVGTPAEIYERPANTFVAGFVGAPPMNLIWGEAIDGHFRHAAFSSAAFGIAATGEVVLGQRPEDILLVPSGTGDATCQVYSTELLGDATLVTLDLHGDRVIVKTGKGCDIRMGETVDVRFDRRSIHMFYAASGARLSNLKPAASASHSRPAEPISPYKRQWRVEMP